MATNKLCTKLMLVAMIAMPLAACGQSERRAESGIGDERVSPDAKPGMELTGGVLMLPVVAGRPGAAYFKISNGGDTPVTLSGVHIDGAGSAQMHETRAGNMAKIDSLEIGPGDTVAFERGGLHVMAFDLSDDLGPGEGQRTQTEITLTFSDGDKLSAPLEIEQMGTAMDMAHSGDSH